jgi:hypothetical protein
MAASIAAITRTTMMNALADEGLPRKGYLF